MSKITNYGLTWSGTGCTQIATVGVKGLKLLVPPLSHPKPPLEPPQLQKCRTATGRTGWYARLMTLITSSSQRQGHARWPSMLTNLNHILNFLCYKVRWLICLSCVGCNCISSFFFHVWCLCGQRVRFCFGVFACGRWWCNVIFLFLFVESFSFEDA